jgi:hypothetical protein
MNFPANDEFGTRLLYLRVLITNIDLRGTIVNHFVDQLLRLKVLKVVWHLIIRLDDVLAVESGDKRFVLLVALEQLVDRVLFVFEIIHHCLFYFFTHCEVLDFGKSFLFVVDDFVLSAEYVLLVEIGEGGAGFLVFKGNDFIYEVFWSC